MTTTSPDKAGRRTARERDAAPGRLRTAAAAWRGRGKDWLDRPLTSLHLVLSVGALLLGFGLLMVLSSSSVTAYQNSDSSFAVFRNQATFAVLGVVAFYLMMRAPIGLLRTGSTFALIGSLVMLLAVLVPGIGSKVYGARSWIRFGDVIQFQPSEVAKLALALWMAHVLAARRHTLGSVKALLVPVLPVFLFMVVLIMAQPDLGTTVTLSIVFIATLYFGGAPMRWFAAVTALGMAGVVGLIFSAGYRSVRLQAWLHPDAYPESGYQLLQSLYSLGNGGIFGVGLGHSTAKWNYLPNADSDFIFAIVGEELGLIGAAVLIGLFGLLAYTGIRIARRNTDAFIKILAGSCTVWLVGQAAINIAYVVGLLPVTGLPLPMISTGGTSLLITLAVFGLLANFARREPQAEAALAGLGPGRMAQFLGIGVRPGGRADSRAAARRSARAAKRKAKEAQRRLRQEAAERRRAADARRRRAHQRAAAQRPRGTTPTGRRAPARPPLAAAGQGERGAGGSRGTRSTAGRPAARRDGGGRPHSEHTVARPSPGARAGRARPDHGAPGAHGGRSAPGERGGRPAPGERGGPGRAGRP